MSHVKTLLPRLILGGMALVLLLGAIPAQAAKPNLKPAISPGPLSHRVELRATVNAKAKLTHVELRIDNKKVQPWIRAHAGWKYTLSYPLTKIAVGMHSAKLQVRDQQNRSTQHTWQFQKLAPLTLSIDKSSVKAGETITLTGQGFTPGTALTIGMGGQNTGVAGNYGSATADSKGAFTLEVTLDKFPDGSPLHSGTITLLAHNRDGSEKAGVDVRILADPSISLNKTAIKAGEKVTVSGQGFTPGASVSISLGGVNTGTSGNYGTAVVDTSGRFGLEVLLDRYPDGSSLKPGTIVLTAHTADFAEKASAQLPVQASPKLTASKSTVRVGEWVVLNGEGFTPGKVVTIGLAGINMGHGTSYGTAAIDANGRFSMQLFLGRYPDGTPLPPGGISLMAMTADGEHALVGLQVVADPAITLSKASIKPGEQVVVTGQGFTPFATVSVSMGPANGGTGGSYGIAQADTNGRFSVAVTLARYPDGSPLKPGTIILTAHTADYSQKASAQLQVLVSPLITLDRTSIQPGDRVTVSGQGFTPGTPVSISMGGVNTGASGNYGLAMVDASGRFSLTVALERYPNGLPLQAGTIVLVAHNTAWDEKASAELQIVTPTPVAPTDLRITSLMKGATSAEPTAVGLQWRDNASNETGFRIQATFTRMNGGTDSQVWNVAANSTTATVSFVAGGINPVSKACFTVSAFNGHGSSAASSQVCAVL